VLQSGRQLLHRSQGAIPKAQKMGHHASAPPPGSSLPTLDSLRSNVPLSAQASSLVNSLETGLSGNNCTQHNNIDNYGNGNSNSNISNNNISNTSSKRGWARPGGDNAPKVCTPWPQDFVVGHGRLKRLLYDDLDVYQFIQGCIAMVEQQQDVVTMRLMLGQLCSTMRDASFNGFESARYAFGTVLSMLEDGALTWADQFQMAEERRSALISRGSTTRRLRRVTPVRAAGVLVPGVPTYAGRTTVDRGPGAPDLVSTTTTGSAHSAPTILPTAL
jgi:hypothetical protein